MRRAMALGAGVALAALAALAVLAAPAPVRAQDSAAAAATAQRVKGPTRDSVLEARVRAVSAELRCPVCQGLSLADSPSELSQEMKDVVREQLASGKSPEEVKAYFVGKYGEWILLEPKARGFNLVVYILPAIAILAGGALIFGALRRWTSSVPDEDAAETSVAADDEEVASPR